MKLLKSVNKIAIILPYKEIYSENFSGAASIWVKDYFKKSILSNSTYIYGSLDKGLKPITKNFTNLNISDYSFSKTKILGRIHGVILLGSFAIYYLVII